MAERLGHVRSALDIQTGGGEVFAWSLDHCPARRALDHLAATESWEPNVAVARRTLSPFGVTVHQVVDTAPLPFNSHAFELVVSRHPVTTPWAEIARVLQPGATFLSQQIGPDSNRELTEFFLGSHPINDARRPERAVADAEAVGLEVVDLRAEALAVTFNDVAAVVHFLRKVIWTVPGFDVDRLRPRLAELHAQIERNGPFRSTAQRFLIEARRPSA